MALMTPMTQRPTIVLQSGALFDLLDPQSSDFTIEDIAHGLANTCRYAGQCAAFYSVAEHSIHVSHVAEGDELDALLHDAAEAFIGDVASPLKRLLPDYRQIETAIHDAIMTRFGRRPDQDAAGRIKLADMRVFVAEMAQIMPKGADEWLRESGLAAADIDVACLEPAKAKVAFLKRFHELRLAA